MRQPCAVEYPMTIRFRPGCLLSVRSFHLVVDVVVRNGLPGIGAACLLGGRVTNMGPEDDEVVE